ELGRANFYAACATGEVEEVEAALSRDADLARRAGGPDGREPILYACFSRFLRGDAARAAGIERIVRLLLERGADANAHYLAGEGEHRCVQTPLFAAAGIANSAALTRLLLDAGADVNELEREPEPSSWKGLGTE